MNTYSIPPLLSSIILFTLFLFGIIKAKKSPVSLVFALICLIGTFLNVDKTLLTVLSDNTLALKISRVDHLFLVFIIPLYFHLAVLVTDYRRWLPLVKVFYGVAIVLMPLTQYPLYLDRVNRFYFGFFAHSGILFYVFSFFSAASLILSLVLLIKCLRDETVSIKRTRIKYILLSFGLAALVTHFDVLIMYGVRIYPLGNFVFIPMSLLGYAIYRHDIMDWKIFLNKGLVFIAMLLISTGFFTGVATVSKNLFGGSENSDGIFIASMVATFFFLYFTHEKVQNFMTRFLQQKAVENRLAIKNLSLEILSYHSAEIIKATVIERLISTFSLHECEVQTVPKIDRYEGFTSLKETDQFWKQGYRIAIPVPSRSRPSYLLLGEKHDMSLFTPEELEMLTILGNHIASAFDNADAYKKIQDFSYSLEKIVEERTKALIQNESLAAVGKLSAGIAHELNNPIASVMSTIEYYTDHLEKGSDIHDDLIFSLSELNRAKEIVKSLLDASRQKEEKKELVDIHGPIEDSLKILYNQYKTKKIEIIRIYDAKHSLITGNMARLCQVFINILKNSIDAIGENPGTITIETLNTVPPQNGSTPSEKQGSDGSTPSEPEAKLICRITDTGEGIDQNTIKDIFQPFFTTKPQGKGIGLGLYIVHEIVMDHGGTINAESNRNQGSTFTVTFPSLQ